MTGLVVPWVYCRCDSPAGEVCPGCGTRVPLADVGGVPLPPLLAGCRRASPSARAAASAVDAALAVGLLGLGVVGARNSTSTPVLFVVLAVVVTPAVLIAYLQDGRTPGRLLIGLRTVDVFTGVPLRRRAALWQRRAGSVLLDVRHGRDPVRPVADVSLAPLPPTPGPAAATPSATPAIMERPHVPMRRSATVSRLSDLVVDVSGPRTERLPLVGAQADGRVTGGADSR